MNKIKIALIVIVCVIVSAVLLRTFYHEFDTCGEYSNIPKCSLDRRCTWMRTVAGGQYQDFTEYNCVNKSNPPHLLVVN